MSDLKGDLNSLKIDRTETRRSPWRTWLLVLIPAGLLLAGFYALRVRQALAAPEVTTVSATIDRGQAPAQGTPILTASGYVVARRKAVVSAKIQGRLADLRVEEGSEVREGDILARLESDDYEAATAVARAAFQRAEADLAENRRQLRVAEDLTKQEVLAADQRDAAVSRVRIAQAAAAQAQAQLAFSEAQLRNTFIRAPFSGTVVKKMAEVGESVAPIPPGVNLSTSSGAIVALADLETLEVEADVAEANVAKVKAGQPAEVNVEAIPDRHYKAVLRQVIPTADRTKATVQVKVTILDKDKNLKPEMSAKVTFLEPESRVGTATPTAVILVPRETVVNRGGQPTVFLVREGKAAARKVVLGLEREGRVVVKEGLAGGETLIVRPGEDVTDGTTVRVKV